MAGTLDEVALYWQKALSTSQQLAFVIDKDHGIVAVSDGMAQRCGTAADDLVGHRCTTLMHGGVAPRDCPLHELLLDGGSHESEVYSEALGTHLFVTVTPLPNATGQVTHVLHVASDIGERKRREDELRASEEQFAALFDDAPLGYQSLDEEGYFLAVNRMWLETLGYAEDEVLGHWFGDFLAPEFREAFRERFPLFKARGAIHSEFELLRKDGRRCTIAFEGRIGRRADGSFRQTHCILTDITERARADAELRESEARFRSLFEHSPVAMWEEDDSEVKAYLEGLVAQGVDDVDAYLRAHPEAYRHCAGLVRGLDTNQAAVKLFEARDREELLARNNELYLGVGQRSVAHFWTAMLRGEPSATFEEVNVTLGGRTLHVLETCTVVPGHEDRYDRVYVADMDITDQKLAAESLQRMLAGAVRALATTVEMRDPYTSGHERRVAELAVAIAGRLTWPEERISDLRVAALLHDVGKIVVPAEILTKPSTLTASELEIVKAHVVAAGEILAPVEFPPVVHQAVAQHHERLDGSGYPLGLCGDEISPGAKVLAVADVYEAMVSHRPYRPALPQGKALAELREGAGTRYDEVVVDCCLGVIDEGFSFTDGQT